MACRLVPASLVLAALAALASGCGGSSPGSLPEDAVAVVAGRPIDRQALDATVERALSRLKAQGQRPPAAGSDQYRALQQSALQYLVQRAELAEEAERLGVVVSDKQVQARLAEVKRQFFAGSEKRYRQALEAQGVTEAELRDELRAQLLSEGLFEKVAAGVKVSPADIAAYYDSHASEYRQPATREVRHILVKTKEQAERLIAQLKRGADFAALAKRFSRDPGTKSVGGKLTVTQGETVPPFEKAAFALKTGAISRPVRSRYGWHVIQALGPLKPARTTPLAQVRAQIRQLLLQRRKQEAVNAWLEDLSRRYAKKIRYAPGFAPPPPETTTTPAVPGHSR
jgi:parvulin-like peptidyl-prolyl isomerase